MSILIKGMEMPKSCFYCPFVDFEYGDCLVDENGHGDPNEPENCPLIPIPPHGRLIDADALIDALQEEIDMWKDAGCDMHSYESVIDNYILDAPTIIEAEEGE